MRAIIIEDEKPSMELMQIIMSGNPYLEIIGLFFSAKEALERIKELVPDVIFSDIELPDMNGMQLAKAVMHFKENIQIVFVTAYEKYAVDAFKVNAVNYILKPITEEDLNITVNRLLKNYNERKNVLQANKKNRIFVLGCFQIYGNSSKEMIKWPTAKVQELFACFVYQWGKEVDKWKLCDILWPESPPKKAEHNLHSAVYRLKSVLREAGIEETLVCKAGKYTLNMEQFTSDVWELKKLIDNTPLVNDGNVENYDRTLSLYRGALFGNEDYAWAEEMRERIERDYLESMKSVAAYYVTKKSYVQAEKYLRAAIEKDPADEEAVALMMNVCYHLGDKIGLVGSYKNLRHYLKQEFGVTPNESTGKLFHSLFQGL